MSGLVEKLRRDKAEIIAIANRYHAENIRLFGSVARGEDHVDSDIDFLVDFRPGSTLFDQAALIDALSTRFGRKVDVVSSRALNKHLVQKIHQEALNL
jgi:predicted nucleotidyltransferase